MDISLVVGLMIPFAGTTLGSAMVFFMRNQLNKKLEKLLLGFAAGVMIAASMWSLLIPSIEMAADQEWHFYYCLTALYRISMSKPQSRKASRQKLKKRP